MIKDKSGNKDLYYTSDHEWIDFRGTIAYVGVCHFKLTGYKQIDKLVFKAEEGFRKQGETIAVIRYNEYEVKVNMPVDGKIVQVNTILSGDAHHELLQYPESTGWIAQIIPSQPYERKNLLMPEQYRMNNKSKYAKS
jgi:glycine cleavage system H lipoate-binding protein